MSESETPETVILQLQRQCSELGSELKALSERVAALTAELAAQRSQVTRLSSEIHTLSSEHEARSREFVLEQDARQKALAETQSVLHARFTELCAGFRQSFDAQVAKFSKQQRVVEISARNDQTVIDIVWDAKAFKQFVSDLAKAGRD